MLAADIGSLPERVRFAVQAFFRANESWLAKVLTQGREERSLDVDGTSDSAARVLYAACQGSMLVSRLFQTKARLDEIESARKSLK